MGFITHQRFFVFTPSRACEEATDQLPDHIVVFSRARLWVTAVIFILSI